MFSILLCFCYLYGQSLRMRYEVITYLLLLQNRVYTSNILIWNPTIGYSHVKFLGNIADVLTQDGHNVTIFHPVMDPHIKTFGNRLSARTISYEPDVLDTNDWLKLDIKRPSLWDSPPCDSLCFKWEDQDTIYEQSIKYCKELLKDQEMISKLNDSKFDIAFSESFDLCAPGFFEVLGIENVVMVSALGMLPRLYEIAGMSEVPSFVPDPLTPYSDDMTFMERLTNLKVHIQMKSEMRRWEQMFWEVFNAKYPGFPTIAEINNRKTALIMTNVNEFAESARPTTNMIRYVGGSTLYPTKPLTKDLENILNERNATVFFSLGSLAQSKDMPRSIKNDIISTFASFPDVTFIWKYEGDDIASFETQPNIHYLKWVPQFDLLADRRLSLFITHGGMNSMLEAMFCAKSMIVIPLFGDQQFNSKNIQRRGLGTIVERNHLNKRTLTEAIKTTLGNKKITRESEFVAAQLVGRPQQYRDDIAKWTRAIIEHGKMDHLLLHSRNLNFMQYYCLDVIAFVVGLASSIAFLTLWSLKQVFSSVRIIKLKSN
ncbi:hypothetical protein RB195_017128 [Necator americanus]|uniref:glucuronosyltransferase n=1 Tax=Necator americanus TaxID=51031 RepID=A0ABR1C3R3_NECAM